MSDSTDGREEISDDNELLVETRQGVRLLRLNRPRARNALNRSLRARLAQAVQSAEADERIRVLVLTGTADCFCAGADIREFADPTMPAGERDGEPTVWAALSRRRKPAVAAVEGHALGGGLELALVTDIIVASETAHFAFPEVGLGILPGAGGTQRFPRAVGVSPALRYLLTGDAFSAAEAQQLGLVAEISPRGQALESALRLARSIAEKPALAVETIRQIVIEGRELPLAEALELEAAGLRRLFQTGDHAEGVRAFLDKRKPSFSGC